MKGDDVTRAQWVGVGSVTPVPVAPAVRFLWRQRRTDTLEGLAWFSVAVVLALFLADGGWTYFTNIRDIATGAGIVAGLVGSDLLLVTLLLAARLPFIDGSIGYDRALGAHRRLGKPVLYLILAHMVLLLVGYGLALERDPAAQAIAMFTSMPDLPQAFIAVALLTLIVALSLVIVRHKLSYLAWYCTHLLVYAAVLLALPHQFSQGELFAVGTWARGYWLSLYIVTFASVAVFRFLIPLGRNLRHGLRGSEVRAEAPGVASIVMTGRDLGRLEAHGGQFFNWRFWSPGLRLEAHPYSLSAAPDGQSLRITVRVLGDGSRRILGLRPGARVFFEGPYGLFTAAARTIDRAVLIGGGIGITPIRALLDDIDVPSGALTVILRGDDPEHVYLKREIEEICGRIGARLEVLVGLPPHDGHTWLPATVFASGETLLTLAPDIPDVDLFVCGPKPWAELVIRDAREAGVPPHRIHAERFDW
jgi:predicted ferric reductase